jgi:hypothetical protein
VPVSPKSVDANPGAGRGSMVATELAMSDFFSIPNALFHLQSPVSVPATVSFDLEWIGPVTERRSIQDAVNGFAGEFFATRASMAWSAHGSGFHFTSDPAASSTSVQAVVGNERNGQFF